MKNLIVSLFLFSSIAIAQDDNQITIKQSGDNFYLEVEQVGYGNIIKQWSSTEGIDGADNMVIIKQANDRGNSNDENIVEIRRIWGDRNTLKLGQGYQVGTNGTFSMDYQEYGDTFVHINVTGDDNTILMTQRTNSSSSGHEYWLHLEGDDNDVYTVDRKSTRLTTNIP